MIMTFEEYLNMERNLTFEEMCNIHRQMIGEVSKDADAKEIYGELV